MGCIYPSGAGDAHHGSLEGHIANNLPVYNVALPLLRAKFPERRLSGSWRLELKSEW
jgi:hypothetical protein